MKEKQEYEYDLLSDCCKAEFDPLGFSRDDGLWQEKCFSCNKPCEPIWTKVPTKKLPDNITEDVAV